MDPIYYAIVGYIMIGILMYMLLKGKAGPVPLFVALPVIAGLILGFSVADLGKIMQKGILTTMNPALIVCFSALYFGILAELGTFNPLINFLVKQARGSLTGITIATFLMTIIIDIEGSVTATILIVIPAMMPIYKKVGMRMQVLFLLVAIGGGIMNMTPWGGPLMRLAAVTNIDPHQMWLHLVPTQLFLVVSGIILAIHLAKVETKRIAAGLGCFPDVSDTPEGCINQEPKFELKVSKARTYFNLGLTFTMIAILFTNKISIAHIFMLGTSILLFVNFPNLKEQNSAISRNSMPPYTVVSIMLAAGMLVGMLNETPMLKEMAGLLLKAIPDFMGPYLHIIMAFVSLPLGIMIGFDAFLFGIIPLCIKVGQNYGISAEVMGQAMLIGKNLGQSLQPVSHVPYLAIAMLGGELKDYFAFTFKYVAVLTTGAIVFAVATGMLPINV